MRVRLSLGHDPLEGEPLGRLEQLTPVLLHSKHPIKRRIVLRNEAFQAPLPPGKRLGSQVSPVEPEQVKGDIVQPPAASEQSRKSIRPSSSRPPPRRLGWPSLR
jgi:hypothetical protein